nr:immunoglobulin light chain junction region [Macaca mulatta]MOW33723.1 immunoglobulin light chain junction region [Macaca mulatta]MOW33761.1 immunoglobulin light chain junction region [Macaca mulatta]MOW33769.1 immunoglobulin light chain junction region [Macaca mulatta]MOW33816.1 immunoglobulin light chain junction region [Macaca mulatta]
CGQGTHWPLTF